MKSSSLLVALATILSGGAVAQPTDGKTATIEHLVASQNYIFQAQTAMPLRGRIHHLTSEFDLTVTKTAIISYLPYYGRSFVAPMNPAQSPLQFTSKDFSYAVNPRKKGGWEVVIKPNDHHDVQQMTLTISSAGYATLQVIRLNSDAISFNGVILAPAAHTHGG